MAVMLELSDQEFKTTSINMLRDAAAKSLQSFPTLCDLIDSKPARPLRPWDSPGKNSGVGCHCLLQIC